MSLTIWPEGRVGCCAWQMKRRLMTHPLSHWIRASWKDWEFKGCFWLDGLQKWFYNWIWKKVENARLLMRVYEYTNVFGLSPSTLAHLQEMSSVSSPENYRWRVAWRWFSRLKHVTEIHPKKCSFKIKLWAQKSILLAITCAGHREEVISKSVAIKQAVVGTSWLYNLHPSSCWYCDTGNICTNNTWVRYTCGVTMPPDATRLKHGHC